jgi:hypothetical protein
VNAESEDVQPPLGFFLEKAVENSAGVSGVLGNGSLRSNRARAISGSAMRGVASYGYARLKEFTFIRRVLWRDPDGNRFQTLEPRGRLEVGALLAAVQRYAALGTVTTPIDVGG